jgi:hypothetical protein
MYTINIDYETADRIVVAVMTEYLKNLEDGVNGGYFVHPDDVERTKKSIEAVKLILSDFGDV